MYSSAEEEHNIQTTAVMLGLLKADLLSASAETIQGKHL